MILTIDRGNTKDKYVVWDSDRILLKDSAERIDSELLASLKEKYDIRKSIFSSVLDERSNKEFSALLKSFFPAMQFTSLTPLPFANNYESKETLGADRLAAVLGAWSKYHRSLLVIDAGTCITFDWLDAQRGYMGGSISPGFMIKYKALNTFTAKLPLITRMEQMPLNGLSTEQCIGSGVVNGTVAEISKTIESYSLRSRDLLTVLTGGDALFVQQQLKEKTLLEENLIAEGLKYILETNAEKN